MALVSTHSCALGFSCARQQYGSRSLSDGQWAPFTPSASYIWLCKVGTVAVGREDLVPGVVWHFDPAETVSSPQTCPYFCAARYRDMWQWGRCVFQEEEHKLSTAPAEVKRWWWSGVAERPWTITEYTQIQTSTACSSPSWRRITQTPANDRWKLRRRRPAVPSAPTLEVRE